MEIEKMITKKEDLINTYVKTDCEELVRLYLKRCKEFGFTWFSGKDINSSKPNGSAVGLNEDIKLSVTNGSLDYFNDKNCRELSLLDLKPRTKTEFVKCEYGEKVSNIVMDFENNAPLCKMVGEEYWPIDELDDLFCLILNECYIYRKVEAEIDERQEFIDTALSNVKLKHLIVVKEAIGDMYDSGKFKLVE